MSYLRDVTVLARNRLDDILFFTGARQAGKTTILRQLYSSLEQKGEPVFFLNLEDPDYRSILNQSPKNLFKIVSFDEKRRNFVFIDEIQYLKDPSNFLKYIYDEHRRTIKLVVSGSSAFYIDRKFEEKEVTVYYIVRDTKLIVLTAVARYGKGFIKQGEGHED